MYIDVKNTDVTIINYYPLKLYLFHLCRINIEKSVRYNPFKLNL